MKFSPLIRSPLQALAFFAGITAAGQWNDPYPADEKGEAIYYSSFDERPKYLDPARSYSSDAYRFIAQIYEPVVQYHYLKRPFKLIPLTATRVPTYQNRDKDGNALPMDAPASQVATSVWTVQIQKGIKYQNHPCFAKGADGKLLYHHVTEAKMKGINNLFQLPETGTRELTAADYVYQIKRMADNRNSCPIFTVVIGKYILGMKKYNVAVQTEIQRIRHEREVTAKRSGILFFNHEEDEKKNPILIDYASIPCPGLKLIDDHTFEIVLIKKYPQFKYWLAMPFFAPMPWEAVHFYSQGPMAERNINLNWYPVGTGAYRMAVYDPNYRVVLVENENFRGEPYPSEGDAGDVEAGLLKDAGKRMPLIKTAVYSRETETAPEWAKFFQGYYDASGIPSSNFFEVMDFTSGSGKLSSAMAERKIRLTRTVDVTIYYLGFNMDDALVGGLDDAQCKLRQAISIVINREKYIQVFRKGRGIAAQGPIPPGIFGNLPGKEGINPYVYDWDDDARKPVRKSIDEARKLMVEAGYPKGISDKDGRPLVLFFDTVQYPGNASFMDWLKKQFSQIGVRLEIRETDYNRFQEKISAGKFQLFQWGWNADYPDPENFLFLLYGPNGKTTFKGENAANYVNKTFDDIFEKLSTMENSDERLALIEQAVEILRHDAPWDFGFYPESYTLYNSWLYNSKPMTIGNNTLKYKRLDPVGRGAYRAKYNKPPLLLGALIIIGLGGMAVPVFVYIRRKE